MVHLEKLSSSLDLIDIDAIELLDGIPSEKRKSVLRCLSATVSSFDKGALLAGEAPTQTRTRYLLSGAALITRVDESGNRSILGTCHAGSIVSSDLTPVLFAKPSIQVISTKPCTTLDFAISQEVEGCPCCVKHVNRIRSNLMTSLAETNSQFVERLDLLSCRTTRERIMTYLQSQRRGSGGKKVFAIPFNRQELADYLCVERSAMSRELSRMKSDGLIDFERNTFKLRA